eukprot:3625175-Pleurochrysis_carterae.AAC.1
MSALQYKHPEGKYAVYKALARWASCGLTYGDYARQSSQRLETYHSKTRFCLRDHPPLRGHDRARLR